MDLSFISSFFDQSVPIGVVFLVVYIVKLDQNIKHIKEILNNHITDTNKKIDNLRTDIKETLTEIKAELKEIRGIAQK